MEAELTITDSIAIKIIQGGAIITGIGNELHLQTTKKRVLSQKLRGKVHNIVHVPEGSDQGRLIAHGEKECMLIQYVHVNNEYNFKELCHFRLTDWISSARFLQNPNEFVLLTSHSVVLQILYNERAAESNVCRVMAKSSSEDKSTLYCSHIHGNTLEELVIFGGNAFGELLIWKPFIGGSFSQNSDCVKYEVELSRRLPAHNGVIFSIDYDDAFGLLTTTSDDRSIRFWKVKSQLKISAIASGYGHVARVFKGKIVHYENQSIAITVAEDSYICIWKTNAELVFKSRIQFGAVVWNFQYDEQNRILYTVGSTGNLVACSLEDALNRRINLSAIPAVLTNDNPKEYVAKAKFLNLNRLVAVTNISRFVYTKIKCAEEKQDFEYEPWAVVDQLNSFKCTVLEVYDNYVAVCGYKRLIIYKYSEHTFKKLMDKEILDGIIRAFHFLNVWCFLVSDDSGKCLLLEGENIDDCIDVPLPYCKEAWTTAAIRIQTPKAKEFLVVSNRMGSILLFKLDVATATCSLLSTLQQVHGALGATMLRIQEVCEDAVFLQSSGHDGSVRLLFIDIESGTIKKHQRTLVPVGWVERLIAIENCEFVLGFNDNHFVVWSHQQDFSVQISCGGGHRCWHYKVSSHNDGTKFLQLLFLKNKELKLHKYKLYNVQVANIKLIRNQWHIRSCNALKLIDAHSCAVPYTILISAGDDNMVKISTLIPGERLEQCTEVHSHISNVRALKILHLDSDIVLIFSGGGRAQLCITELNIKSFRIQERLNYTLNRSGLNNKELVTFYQTDPETRIMACDVIKTNSDSSDIDICYLVFLGCSDGYLRKVEVNKYFQVVSERVFYYGCCLLQVRAFANCYLVTAGTDGNLRFFDLQLIELSTHLSHHASGVNALDILFESDTCILHILTGGDDQSVSYTSIRLQGDKSFQIQNKYRLVNAHSAQVTAVQIVFDGKTISGYTSGLDQTINKVDIKAQRHELICHTCIADVKGLLVDNSGRHFVYGCGIQIFKLKR